MKQFRGIFLAILSSSTFGMIPFFALPVIQEGVGIDSILFYRFAVSAVIVGLYLLFVKSDFRITAKELVTLFFLGVFYALTSLCLTASYLYIPSSVATTVHFLYPVLVTTIMILFFKSKVSLSVVTAAVMAIVGVYFLSGGKDGGVINVRGLALVLVTVLTYAIYIVGVNKSCVQKMDGLKMTFYVLLSSALIFGGNLLIKGNGLDAIPSYKAGINLFLLALIPTLISDFTLILAIKQVGSTITAILGCMEPLTALFLGVCFLNESLEGEQLVGIFVILSAVFIIISENRINSDFVKRFIPVFLFNRSK